MHTGEIRAVARTRGERKSLGVLASCETIGRSASGYRLRLACLSPSQLVRVYGVTKSERSFAPLGAGSSRPSKHLSRGTKEEGGRPSPSSGLPPSASAPGRRAGEHLFGYGGVMADLPTPELVENRLRSIAMLPPGAPALNRDEALELLEQLNAALLALRKLRTQGEVR
jgi:hypothetical protein